MARIGSESAGLRSQARSVDLYGVAAFAQAAQERLDQRAIAEEALPFGV
jgi:hypothetical protein